MYLLPERALSIQDIVQGGLNTKRIAGILLAASLLAIIVTASGCVNIENLFQPAPTVTPVVVTLTPTPRPTATPVPTPIVRQSNWDVKVLPVMDKGIIAFDSYPVEDQQYENITIVLANDGAKDAKNVIITLTETDGHGGNMLVQQKFEVGDMRRGERKDYTLVTEKHDQASSILIKVDLEWGENGEYYNPKTYIDVTKSIIWMIKF